MHRRSIDNIDSVNVRQSLWNIFTVLPRTYLDLLYDTVAVPHSAAAFVKSSSLGKERGGSVIVEA